MVWAGAMICVSCLMVGGLLGSYLTLGECAFAILIGYGLCGTLYVLNRNAGLRFGSSDFGYGWILPRAKRRKVHNQRSFGNRLYRLVRRSIRCLREFRSAPMFAAIFNVNIPVWISIVFWGVIMLLTACYGFKGLKLLNIIAVPLLIIVCVYGLILAIAKNDGMELVKLYKPVYGNGPCIRY